MKRTLVISDIHGCYEQFNRLLELMNYNRAEDQLIMLGDYVDRGMYSKEVVKKVMQLVHEDGAVALMGNHDQRFIHVATTKDEKIASTFMESLPYYDEDEAHIYVHAGLDPSYLDWKNQPTKEFLYIREPFIANKTVVSKTVVFGHTKTVDIHDSADIWFGEDKIGIDGGCSARLQLNGLEIKAGPTYRAYKVKC